MKYLLKISLASFALFLFFSNNIEAQKKSNPIVKKEAASKYWFAGKNFGNNRKVSANPEEGGADFLNIKKDKTADFKVGDMVEAMKWEVAKNKLILTNIQAKREIKFTVGKNFLTDEFGTKWTIMK